MSTIKILKPTNESLVEHQEFFDTLGARETFSWKCEECGEEHLDEKRNFIRRKIKCLCQKRKERIYEVETELNKQNFTFLQEALNSYSITENGNIDLKKAIYVKCLNCGKEGYEYYYNLKNGHKKCNCNAEKKFTRDCTTEEFLEKWHFLNRENFILCEGETYKNRNSKYRIKCKHCGKEDSRWGISLIDSQIKCKYCNIGSKSEQFISHILNKLGVYFIREYQVTIEERTCRFDFYLPKNNYIIEFHGEQHFKPFDFFGGEEKFKDLQIRDKLKKDWCLKQGICFKQFNYKDSEKDIENWLSLMFNDYPEREYTISD